MAQLQTLNDDCVGDPNQIDRYWPLHKRSRILTQILGDSQSGNIDFVYKDIFEKNRCQFSIGLNTKGRLSINPAMCCCSGYYGNKGWAGHFRLAFYELRAIAPELANSAIAGVNKQIADDAAQY